MGKLWIPADMRIQLHIQQQTDRHLLGGFISKFGWIFPCISSILEMRWKHHPLETSPQSYGCEEKRSLVVHLAVVNNKDLLQFMAMKRIGKSLPRKSTSLGGFWLLMLTSQSPQAGSWRSQKEEGQPQGGCRVWREGNTQRLAVFSNHHEYSNMLSCWTVIVEQG